jgi:hypothetical protein
VKIRVINTSIYCLEYKERLGIDIDLESVTLNPGLRYISKLLLNSLWGKFGQRNNLTKTTIVNSPAAYYDVVLDKRNDIRQILPVSSEIFRITYAPRRAYIEEHGASNVVVALWTTRFLAYNTFLVLIFPILSAARLKLYEYMNLVQNTPGCEILYTGIFALSSLFPLFPSDTDSIILSHPRGACPISEGSFLGEMSREYPDYRILEFVGAGPKQYALKMEHRDKQRGELKFVLKIRGITIDKRNEDVLPYQKFKDMVIGTEFQNAFFNYCRIGPTKDANVRSTQTSKVYRTVNTKGYVRDLKVFPFGFE